MTRKGKSMSEEKKNHFARITDWCHAVIRACAPEEGFYIDATMGKGKDTLFLCTLAKNKGKVLAFDIQKEALEATGRLLKENRMEERARLILDGHENMASYASEESADVICFNFGYLPGGNHQVATRPDTSIKAVKEGLAVLKSGGLMSLCIYSGGDTGFAEKDALLSFLKELPSRRFTVIVNCYHNRENHPPMPVFIFKK